MFGLQRRETDRPAATATPETPAGADVVTSVAEGEGAHPAIEPSIEPTGPVDHRAASMAFEHYADASPPLVRKKKRLELDPKAANERKDEK
jgi:hypothetical protein